MTASPWIRNAGHESQQNVKYRDIYLSPSVPDPTPFLADGGDRES